MVTLKINNVPVTVEEGTTILNAAAKAGVSIPTLCFLKDLNEIGACRVCVVEIKGKEKLVTACNNVVKEGMEILTNSPKVRNTRKINVELILSQHDAHCATCVRSRNCSLQNLANDLDIIDQRFQKDFPRRNKRSINGTDRNDGFSQKTALRIQHQDHHTLLLRMPEIFHIIICNGLRAVKRQFFSKRLFCDPPGKFQKTLQLDRFYSANPRNLHQFPDAPVIKVQKTPAGVLLV